MKKRIFKTKNAQLPGATNLAFWILGIVALFIIATAIIFIMIRFDFI